MSIEKIIQESVDSSLISESVENFEESVCFSFDPDLLSEAQLMELKSALRNVGRVVGAVAGGVAGSVAGGVADAKYGTGAAGRGASTAVGALAGAKSFGSAGAAVADKILKGRIKRGNEKISKWKAEGSSEENKAKISNMQDKIAKWQKELND